MSTNLHVSLITGFCFEIRKNILEVYWRICFYHIYSRDYTVNKIRHWLSIIVHGCTKTCLPIANVPKLAAGVGSIPIAISKIWYMHCPPKVVHNFWLNTNPEIEWFQKECQYLQGLVVRLSKHVMSSAGNAMCAVSRRGQTLQLNLSLQMCHGWIWAIRLVTLLCWVYICLTWFVYRSLSWHLSNVDWWTLYAIFWMFYCSVVLSYSIDYI